MPTVSATAEVRSAIVHDLDCKAAYRESLAEKYPRQADKHEDYAESIRLASEYVAGLPDDDPTLAALADCDALQGELSGCFELPEGIDGAQSLASNAAVHCDARGRSEVAAWFEGWAKGAIAEAEETRRANRRKTKGAGE
jgi:hypothetical protein